MGLLEGWSGWRKYRKLPADWRNIVIYSESGQDWHYFAGLIEVLNGELQRKVTYITSDDTDPATPTGAGATTGSGTGTAGTGGAAGTGGTSATIGRIRISPFLRNIRKEKRSTRRLVRRHGQRVQPRCRPLRQRRDRSDAQTRLRLLH